MINKEKIYKFSPQWLKNILVSFYNYKESKYRYSKDYYKMREYVKKHEYSTREELTILQEKEFSDLFNHAIKNSQFYKEFYNKIDVSKIKSVSDLKKLPILSKNNLQLNVEKNRCVPLKNAWIIKTGGTTGRSLKVYGTVEDASKRIAFLDEFRARFGYEKGKKVAWFSGKDILSEKDLHTSVFWRTDFINKIRYYSTFHIDETSVRKYIKDLDKYKPDYIVGFPSSLLDIARLANALNMTFEHKPVCIFPTAETVTDEMSSTLSNFYNCNVQDQYAASEGVPIITTCEKGKYHIEILAGVFEVLDEDGNDTLSGRLVVTGFHTKGCPLIRYDVGDRIELYPKNEYCDCGRSTPLAKKILGRIDDYLLSYSGRRINLGNISNSLKDVKGVRRFQVQQYEQQKIVILIERITNMYNENSEETFLKNIHDRFEKEMVVVLEYVEEIPLEASGKFRIAKNLIPINE